MNKIFLISFIFLGLETAYSQDKAKFRIDTDSIIFVNFTERDLMIQKKFRLLEARQQNRISGAWDLKQFYLIDSKRFKRDMDKLDKELKKGKFNYKFISVPNDLSPTKGNCSMITDFKVEESKNGKYLMIYETSALLDRDRKLIMDGDATGIIKKLRALK